MVVEEGLELAGEFVEAFEIIGGVFVRVGRVPLVGQASVFEGGDVGARAGDVVADTVAFADGLAGFLGKSDRQFVGGGAGSFLAFTAAS